MDVSPHDYDRAERRRSSWWGSRHPHRDDGTPSTKKINRLTLIDLLLLIVMMGVLIPLISRIDPGLEVGKYRVHVRERRQRDTWIVSLSVVPLVKSGEPGDEYVEWILYDQLDLELHRDHDLVPEPGQTRKFFYLVQDDIPAKCRISVGSQAIWVELTMDKQ